MNEKIVYKKPKGYQKLIQSLGEDIQNNYQMVQQIQKNGINRKKISSPQMYAQIKKKMSDVFIESIKSHDFEYDFPKIQGKKYHMVIGPISSGKSSLINEAFEVYVPVGVGQITQSFGIVAQNSDIQIFDAPGINECFEFISLDNLRLLKNMDQIFFCFCDSLKSSNYILRVLKQVKPNNFCIIRTQVDRHNQSDCKSIEQQLQKDRQYLQSIGISDKVSLYAVSVRKPIGFRDNEQVFSKLKGIDINQLYY